RARAHRDASADHLPRDAALFGELLLERARDLSDRDVELGDLDLEAERGEALERALHLRAARPLPRIHVHLEAHAVDGNAALLEPFHELIRALGLRIGGRLAVVV